MAQVEGHRSQGSSRSEWSSLKLAGIPPVSIPISVNYLACSRYYTWRGVQNVQELRYYPGDDGKVTVTQPSTPKKVL